jgi:hypothetical protein
MLRYLRQHGNYLTPGEGITLASGVAVVLRGVFLNLLVWLPIITAIMITAFVISRLAVGSIEGLRYIVDGLGIYQLVAALKWDDRDALLLFALAMWLALFLALGFLVVCTGYSLKTRLPRGTGSRRYDLRRKFERRAGIVLMLIVGLLVVGALPTVATWLKEQGQGAEGPIAIILGAGSALWTFFKSAKKAAGKVPLWLVASAGALIMLYGVLVVSFEVGIIWYRITWSMVEAISAETTYWSVLWALPVVDMLVHFLIPVLFLVAILTGVFVNLNYISLHRYYRDRLMEAFLPDVAKALAGETDAAKNADPARMSAFADPATTCRPYHIVNANVVLVDSPIRLYRIRGGDSFVFSPLFCGSNSTGWAPTGSFMGDGMTLATAMAISGAAANPNTGVGGRGLTRNPFVSLLMALMNFRLGYWASHPNPILHPTSRPNHFYPGLFEVDGMFGHGFREDRRFLQLSDGGHFENLALYELIRRRVKLIVLCDGAADPEFSFSDLQVAMRRVEADFGARIVFDDGNKPDVLVPRHDAGFPKGVKLADRGYIAGTITYADKSEGSLVYLKTTMVKCLSIEVRGYKGANPDFPDQSTADQFFDEEQFEAYRELGYTIAGQLLDDAGSNVGPLDDRTKQFMRPAPEAGGGGAP